MRSSVLLPVFARISRARHGVFAVLISLLVSPLPAAAPGENTVPGASAGEISGGANLATDSAPGFFSWALVSAALLSLVLAGAWLFARRGMRRWSVGRRIGAGFVPVLGLLAVVATVGYGGLHRALRDFHEFRGVAATTNLAARMQAQMRECRIWVKEFRVSALAADARTTRERLAEMIGLLETGKRGIQEEDRRRLLVEVEKQLSVYSGLFDQLESGVLANDADATAKAYSGMSEVGGLIDKRMADFAAEFTAEQVAVGARIDRGMQLARGGVLLLGLSAIILGVGLSLIIAGGIVRPLRAITGDLADGAANVQAAAGQVAGSAQTLAEGSSEQAASLEESSASLEEVTSMTRRNSESAARARELSAQTRGAAETGAVEMGKMNEAMEAIKRSSGEIAKIIKTIDEIAFQTNILALNAAVEAARAGDAGMGFAVVADEVRALAHRSAEAARETATKIEDAVGKSEHGVRISLIVTEALRQIVTRAGEVDALVVEIAAASGEQSQGIEQVDTAVARMATITQSNAAGAEESASAAEELNAQSEELARLVTDLGALVGTAGRGAGREVGAAPSRTSAATRSTPPAEARKARARLAESPSSRGPVAGKDSAVAAAGKTAKSVKAAAHA